MGLVVVSCHVVSWVGVDTSFPNLELNITCRPGSKEFCFSFRQPHAFRSHVSAPGCIVLSCFFCSHLEGFLQTGCWSGFTANHGQCVCVSTLGTRVNCVVIPKVTTRFRRFDLARKCTRNMEYIYSSIRASPTTPQAKVSK